MHRNLIDLQRAVAFNSMGKEAQALVQEANEAPTEWERSHILRDADRVLDAMSERKAAWAAQGA